MSLSERTASDYAIEHAGYLARSVTAFLDLIGREAVFDEDAQQHLREEVADHLQAMRSGVYEFEKRAARAEGVAALQQAALVDYKGLVPHEPAACGEGTLPSPSPDAEPLCPPSDWIREQAKALSSSKGADSVGALSWNLTVAFRRWADRVNQLRDDGSLRADGGEG